MYVPLASYQVILVHGPTTRGPTNTSFTFIFCLMVMCGKDLERVSDTYNGNILGCVTGKIFPRTKS